MNILLVIEGAQTRGTTFTLLSFDERSLFLQFSPEFHLQGLNMIELYSDKGIAGVRDHLIKGQTEWINGYIIITIDQLVRLLQHFFPEGVYYGNEQLNEEELQRRLTYTVDLAPDFPCLGYQRYFFRQLFQRLLKKRHILRLLAMMKEAEKYLQTDIVFADWAKIFTKGLNRSESGSEKMIFPLADTFRIVDDHQGKRIKMIDIETNERFLRKVLL